MHSRSVRIRSWVALPSPNLDVCMLELAGVRFMQMYQGGRELTFWVSERPCRAAVAENFGRLGVCSSWTLGRH